MINLSDNKLNNIIILTKEIFQYLCKTNFKYFEGNFYSDSIKIDFSTGHNGRGDILEITQYYEDNKIDLIYFQRDVESKILKDLEINDVLLFLKEKIPQI